MSSRLLSWSIAPLSAASSAAVGVVDGSILLAGGQYRNPDNTEELFVTRVTQVYDPGADEWSEGPLMNDFRSHAGGVVYQCSDGECRGVSLYSDLESGTTRSEGLSTFNSGTYRVRARNIE